MDILVIVQTLRAHISTLCSASVLRHPCERIFHRKGYTATTVVVLWLILFLIISGDVELNPGPLIVSLGIHHLKTLRNILGSKELESKWHDIGLQLSIEPHVLERIELDHKDDGPGRLLTETLLFWLRENTDVPVSWQSLINILKSPSVKETNLASQIQSLVFESNHSEIDQAACCLSPANGSIDGIIQPNQFTIKDATIYAVNRTTTLDTEESDSASNQCDTKHGDHLLKNHTMEDTQKEILFPLLTNLYEHDKTTLVAKFKHASFHLRNRFYDILDAFRDFLHKSEYSVENLRDYLRRLDVYDPVEKVELPKQQEHRQELKNAKSTDDVCEVVEKYCCFFSYDILGYMIEKYETDSDELHEELWKYTNEFNDYAKQRIYRSADNTKLYLILDSRHYKQYTTEALSVLQAPQSKVYNGKLNLTLCWLNEDGKICEVDTTE